MLLYECHAGGNRVVNERLGVSDVVRLLIICVDLLLLVEVAIVNGKVGALGVHRLDILVGVEV